jgi:hypothetical protein
LYDKLTLLGLIHPELQRNEPFRSMRRESFCL